MSSRNRKREGYMEERIELRCASGPLLGVLVGGTAIEVKRGARLFEIDLHSTLLFGAPVILERVLEGPVVARGVSSVANRNNEEPEGYADSAE
jgi:hypothetical protein